MASEAQNNKEIISTLFKDIIMFSSVPVCIIIICGAPALAGALGFPAQGRHNKEGISTPLTARPHALRIRVHVQFVAIRAGYSYYS